MTKKRTTRQLVYLIIFPLTLLGVTSLFAESATLIPEVNLKSSSTKGSTQSSSMQTTQFSNETIEQSPVVDLSQLFQQEQSIVRLTNNSGDTSQTALSLRGFGDNAVANSLILVDGFPLINSSLLAPFFNSIPLADVERIDIFQGSGGSLWGDQAVGGVVNIVTKHPKKLFAKGTLSLGSYSRNYYNVLTGDRFDNGLFFKVFGLTGQTNNYRAHNQQSENNIAAQTGFDYAKGVISLNVQTYTNTTNFPGGLTQEQFNNNPSQASDFNNYSHYQTSLIQLLNKQELTEDWRLETRLSHQDTNGNGIINDAFASYDAYTRLDPKFVGHIQQYKIIAGYDGVLSRYKLANSKVYAKTNSSEHDLYGQVITPLNATLDLTLGTRGAWQGNTIDEEVSEPSVYKVNRVWVTEQGLLYHPNDTMSFYLRRDGNFSFPKANEQTWVPSNETALNVQKGVSYETGTTLKTDKQKTQVSLYRLDLTNEIAFNPAQTDTQPFGAYNNLDATRRYGITLTESFAVTSKAMLDGQINYVDARFASGAYSGNLVPAVPAINGNVGLNYAFTDHWQTRYSWLYTGTRYASDDVENIGPKLSSYWLNDMAIQYLGLMQSVNLSFEVLNIFNQTYAAYAYYNSFTAENVYYPAVGRNYLFTMKVNL